MKRLLFAIAGAAAFSAFAADPAAGANDISFVGFENYTADRTVIGYGDDGQSGNSLWACAGDDASLVKTYGGDNAAAPNLTSYPSTFADGGDKYLALDTNGSELQRIFDTQTNSINVAASGTYIDTLVQFTPSESAPTAGDLTGAKLAIWLGVDSVNNTTNLMVQAGIVAADGTVSSHEYKLNASAEPNTWYRLTVTALKNITKAPADIMSQDGFLNGFQIKLDGTLLQAATDTAFAEGYITGTLLDAQWGWLNAETDAATLTLLRSNTLFPSIAGVGSDDTLTSVGFKGTGAIDDFVVTTEMPDFTPPGIDFTLTWPQGYTAVSYTINGGDPVAIDGNTVFPISVPDGAVVAFTFQNADGARKTMSATASSSVNEIDASTATYVWADYLGDAVNGAYTIDDVNDLDMLRKGVAAGLATAGETFKQTANIDMTSADPFAGIGTYSAVITSGVSFKGSYNGQGYQIANVTFTDRDYAGIFNQVNGGTIQNLTVSNLTFVGSGSKYCASIVGHASNGATLQNLTATGSFGSDAKPGNHNMAGIVIRANGGATSETVTTIQNCTNNAAIYGTYTKIGGICALTQNQTGFGSGTIAFIDCVNNGSVTKKAGSTDTNGGFGGILAYAANITNTFTRCVNNGTITTDAGATFHVGQIIGHLQQGSFIDNGGNAAASTEKMLGTHVGGTITGFQYATVANNVATTVTELMAGNTYLLEGDVPDSDTPVFTLTTVGATIAFDEALGYEFAGTVASSGAAGNPRISCSGTVTTYTADYFPRTARALQDGSAEHPFEIADLDDLQALQAAVAANVGRGLSYVQTADIALTGAWEGIGVKGGKDIVAQATYDNGAFTGVYDGGNYTISNFLMENGTDYGALFNSIYQATIKNLKLSWGSSTLCANASSSGGDTGASFVGVAKESTLQNLTAVAGAVTTVSASKDMGGIVGYLMAGSTVDSCTNELNVASLKDTGRKCGGIAIITQGGSGSAIIRNCKNSGTVTAANKGGILGYVGVATEIDGCENTAAVQLFHFQSGSVTASGVNKGNATVASNDKSGGVTNLYFATVSGDVATFVADNALALNGSYKVMSAGATATFAFAEAGTIAFDTALFTPTYAITAAEGLTLTDATSGTVKTYTAEAPAAAEWASDSTTVSNQTAAAAYPSLADSALATANAGELTDWAKKPGVNVAFADVVANPSAYVDAFLLNCAPTAAAVAEEKEEFVLTITFDSEGNPVINTPAGKDYNGKLQLKGSNDLSTWTNADTTAGYQFFKFELSL